MTPEGYLLSIDQKMFDNRDTYHSPVVNFGQSFGKSMVGGSEFKPIGMRMANPMAVTEAEQRFSKICQSMELYETEACPIMIEFLEF